MTWEQGAKLAPDDNRMRSRDPAEFARRYGPDAEALHHVLDCAQEVVEAWRCVERDKQGDDRIALELSQEWETAAKLHPEAALEAMRSTPR